MNGDREGRIRRTWSVSRCTGQQHHLLVKVWTVSAKTVLSWYVQGWVFFFVFFSTDIFTLFVKLLLGNRSMSSLLFLLPLCSVVYCVYFGKESLTFWLAHPEFELFCMIFPMRLGLDSWCNFFWSWNGTLSLFLFIYFIVICYCRFLDIFTISSSYLPWTLVTQPSS